MEGTLVSCAVCVDERAGAHLCVCVCCRSGVSCLTHACDVCARAVLSSPRARVRVCHSPASDCSLVRLSVCVVVVNPCITTLTLAAPRTSPPNPQHQHREATHIMSHNTQKHTHARHGRNEPRLDAPPRRPRPGALQSRTPYWRVTIVGMPLLPRSWRCLAH